MENSTQFVAWVIITSLFTDMLHIDMQLFQKDVNLVVEGERGCKMGDR
jgi:hypothetical protein